MRGERNEKSWWSAEAMAMAVVVDVEAVGAEAMAEE